MLSAQNRWRPGSTGRSGSWIALGNARGLVGDDMAAIVFSTSLVPTLALTDGYWIITMGVFGLVGFLGQFGLLGLPVFRAAKALKFAQTMPERVNLAALALIVAINMIDLLPNASLSPWTWLLVGALLGRTELLYAVAHQRSRKL